MTWALIVVNVAVFLGYADRLGNESALGEIFWTWGLVPVRLAYGEGYATLVTSMFVHAGVIHLGGNMLFLWIFGDNLEDKLGHAGFLGFYLACGLGAAAMQILSAPMSEVPMVGASGAIAGVLGGYLLLFPRARVDVLFFFIVFFRIIALPAWIMLGAWFALQVVSGLTNPADLGGVAYWAHAGGFLVGVVLAAPVWLRLGGARFWTASRGHPDTPETRYRVAKTSVPRVRRRR